MSDSEMATDETIGYEPNALTPVTALGTASSAETLPVRARMMQAIEMSVPPDMLRQLEMFTSFAAQGQDAMGLIQELFRRTDLLGQAVMQIPVELSTHVTEQTRQSIGMQVAGMQRVHDSMTMLDEGIKARLSCLEADICQLRLDVDSCQRAFAQFERAAADAQSARVQLDATIAMCNSLKQSMSSMTSLDLEVQARTALEGRVDDLQDMLNEHAAQLDEVSAKLRTARQSDSGYESPGASPLRSAWPGTEFYNLSSPEVISCSPDRVSIQRRGPLPELPPWPSSLMQASAGCVPQQHNSQSCAFPSSQRPV